MVFKNDKEKGISSVLTSEELTEFKSVYSSIVQYFTKLSSDIIPESNLHLEWMRKGLKYNVKEEGKLSGLLVPLTYKTFTKEVNQDELKLCYHLAWVAEFLQTSFRIAGEIIEGRETSSDGKLCWHKRKEVGMNALNDCFLCDGFAHEVLRNIVGQQISVDLYLELLDFVCENGLKAVFGRTIDCGVNTGKDIAHDLKQIYSMERYRLIVKYKWSHCRIFVPIGIGLIITKNNVNKEILLKIKAILLEVGLLIQVQNDYDSFFKKNSLENGIHAEILKHKYNWLFVQAVELCNSVELKELFVNYERNDLQGLRNVRKLYTKLNLFEKFQAFRVEIWNKIKNMIVGMPVDIRGKLRDLVWSVYNTLG